MRVTKKDLALLLKDMLIYIEEGKSAEGRLEYHFLGNDEYEVIAAQQVENEDKQGSVWFVQ